MLTTGTTTLDHLLTIGQCPTSSWGLGFQGFASKSAEETVFVKGSSKEKEIQVSTKLSEICTRTTSRESRLSHTLRRMNYALMQNNLSSATLQPCLPKLS
ncbi:hypothetical protein DY000_02013503 [Brassica cretica]|uniref:Uncharacterized protein n=1 Tax=Brassica cretica TaxID=69181 RepID=A0ABQ7CPF1_BRACR|nr:hypothetical protein DY000_02013503 [Brassica cretica]